MTHKPNVSVCIGDPREESVLVWQPCSELKHYKAVKLKNTKTECSKSIFITHEGVHSDQTNPSQTASRGEECMSHTEHSLKNRNEHKIKKTCSDCGGGTNSTGLVSSSDRISQWTSEETSRSDWSRMAFPPQRHCHQWNSPHNNTRQIPVAPPSAGGTPTCGHRPAPNTHRSNQHRLARMLSRLRYCVFYTCRQATNYFEARKPGCVWGCVFHLIPRSVYLCRPTDLDSVIDRTATISTESRSAHLHVSPFQRNSHL